MSLIAGYLCVEYNVIDTLIRMEKCFTLVVCGAIITSLNWNCAEVILRMIKMILTDLDHTLLKSDGTISIHTLETLQQFQNAGIPLAIATARYWIGAEKYIEQLKPMYQITTDGTLVHSEDECIYSCEFSVEETNLIINVIKEFVPYAEITVASGKTVYWNSKNISASEKLHKAIYCEYDTILNCKANKIVAELPQEELAIQIAKRANCKLQSYRGEKWYAFLPLNSGKMKAINVLAEKCNIQLTDIVAFGDDKNDIEMLSACGIGVAVSNAIPDVLCIADAVTDSNDADGVAKWLSKNISI